MKEVIIDKKFEIMERFPSYRNESYKIKFTSDNNHLFAVLKVYSNTEKCLIEYKNLIELSNNGIKVPEVLEKHDNKLFLEYIGGNLVNELIEKQHIGNWIEKFAWWMSNIHRIESSKGRFLKDDCNLRNFIWNNDQIYGLDFEKRVYGNPDRDIGDICFFILTNSPSWTDKKKIITQRFINAYELYSGNRVHNIDNLIEKSAQKAKLRRGKYRKELV
ncbi:hypothetical protein [Methanobacterium sp. ACI-7]|uniref:hypothetical protein n=1 Tax=unclassified Methanobacterium TaxID=2627676 RepID=UPI0039C3EFE5